MQKVFGDMDGTNSMNITEEFSSDEEDELLPEDWNDWVMNLSKWQIMDELTLAEIDDSQGESFDNMPTDIPFSALNALLNLSFDAVLQADWGSLLQM